LLVDVNLKLQALPYNGEEIVMAAAALASPLPTTSVTSHIEVKREIVISWNEDLDFSETQAQIMLPRGASLSLP
jgi:hypothetical protein